MEILMYALGGLVIFLVGAAFEASLMDRALTAQERLIQKVVSKKMAASDAAFQKALLNLDETMRGLRSGVAREEKNNRVQ